MGLASISWTNQKGNGPPERQLAGSIIHMQRVCLSVKFLPDSLWLPLRMKPDTVQKALRIVPIGDLGKGVDNES